ncbi:hypothetical protein CRG98_014423, partial [Punica granatum]
MDLGIKLGRMEDPANKGEESSKKAPATPSSSSGRRAKEAPGVENSSTGATEPRFAGSTGRRCTEPTPQAILAAIQPISPSPNFDPSIQDQSKRCEYHQGAPGHTLDNCWRLRDEIQRRIDSNRLTFNAIRPPNVQANPLPDHRPNSGPSINMISVCVSERDEEAQRSPPPFVINYTPEELTDKGKAPAVGDGATPERSHFPSKKVTEEEAEAFMKIVKASEYKVLTAAQVPKETPPNRIEETIGSIFSNTISFSDDELPSEGWSHSRALHIVCKCNNYIIGRVMIDNGSALNVCPVTTLKQMNIIEARKGNHLHCLAAYYGRLNRGTPVPPLSRFFPGPSRIIGGTLDGPSSDSDDTSATPSAVYAVTEEIPSGVHVCLAHENEKLDNWTSVPRYSVVIADSLRRLEDRRLTSLEPTEEINVGTQEDPRILKIGTSLDPTQRVRMIDFLTMYQEVFAWSYADMPGLDPSIVKHFLPLDTKKFPPKRQQLRRQRASLLLRIKEEVVKQINAGFLEVCNNSEWVANIVPVEKKDGRVRVCADYRDLNKASPKDNFPLPHIDILEEESTHTEHAIYYLSKKFTDGESNYPEIEKMCCALVWVMQRLRQYTLYHTVRLLSKADPLKYLLDSPSSTRNLAKWRCQLTEYDIEYVSRTSVKGQAIADHFAEFPIEDHTPINPDFPDEGILRVDDEGEEPGWKMYFDGAVNSMGSGIGAVLISSDGHHYPVAAKIDLPCTNNVAEYKACILGLQAAIDFKVKELEVFGDSMLTIFQTLGQWKTKDAKLVPYHEYLEKLTENFEDISFTYTPRMTNQFADALATLASMVSITRENLIEPLEIEIAEGPAHCNAIEASEAKPWIPDDPSCQHPILVHRLPTRGFPTEARDTIHRPLGNQRQICGHGVMSNRRRAGSLRKAKESFRKNRRTRNPENNGASTVALFITESPKHRK